MVDKFFFFWNEKETENAIASRQAVVHHFLVRRTFELEALESHALRTHVCLNVRFLPIIMICVLH